MRVYVLLGMWVYVRLGMWMRSVMRVHMVSCMTISSMVMSHVMVSTRGVSVTIGDMVTASMMAIICMDWSRMVTVIYVGRIG